MPSNGHEINFGTTNSDRALGRGPHMGHRRRLCLSRSALQSVAGRFYIVSTAPSMRGRKSQRARRDVWARIQPQRSLIWLWLRDAARALAHVHKHNLVHNDVKPSNMYLAVGEEDDGEGGFRCGSRCCAASAAALGASSRSPSPSDVVVMGRLMLGDFGQACENGKLPDGEEGDSTYMAPEVLKGSATPSCDMFSLGISFYELAAYVELPADGPLWHDLRKGKLPQLPQGRSQDLYNLLCKLMDPVESRRPTAREVLAHPRIRRCSDDLIPFRRASVLRVQPLVRQGSF